jgi:type I restriction-modification system DNA methylase subunit/PAS domain-containing protein
MATQRNRELEKKIEDLLKSPVRTKDDLASLFCKLLGFQYAGRVLSSRDKGIWGDSDAARIAADQKFEILAGHGDVASGGFAIIYGELKPFNLSVQRTLILQLRNNFPAAIFLFADRATLGGDRGARVHIIHSKLSGPVSGDAASQRLILRRFRVGPGERYRTAAERLAKLDISQRPNIGTLELGDICDVAFDKEALTDEFFKKLDRHIREIETDLQKHQPDFTPADAFTQAQLLIERLVFLYFAQNRGWLNQDAEYLISNFTKFKKDGDGFSYYQEFLHRLFRSLAEPSFGDRLEGIPFLNGGLFDDDEFRPPTSKLKIRNETFAALFEDLLEAYNFTVREDTPLSQEVAVDPEMLGKIFESIVLHAESAGEEFQAPDKRKATGSYYTPRIVVHFICRETLRLYFVNRAASLADAATRETWSERISRLFKEIEPDDSFNEVELKTLRAILSPNEAKRCLALLNGIRTLDPSVGSGAFPVGLLHELVSLRRVFECVVNGYQDPVKGEGSTWKQKAKEHFIQRSLFGVDIQQQAIEICRLRLWLSLLVDYELGVNPFEAERGKFIEAINHISQLPNLEMNFRRGDSLHDYICGHPVRLDGTQLADYTDDLARIEKSGQELHQAKRAEKKKRLRLEILAQRLDLGKRVVTDQIRALSTNQQVGDLFGLTGSDAATQRRVDAETVRLRDAHKQLEKDEKEFQRVQAKPMDKNFYRNLRKLEGAEPDGPHNFVWRLDFPHVLSEKDKGTVLDNLALVNEAGQGELVKAKSKSAAGFDLVVGNPPFVTARNAEKRELYRARWPRVCYKNYLLVCPFFELSFSLLKPDAQLGFIVSNAFAQRDLGQPLIEDFFPTVDLQKLVDCSGLLFPGHGTPTCLVFGAQRKPDEKSPIRVSAILPGGGDLRTPPEESPLWHTLASQNDNPGYSDARVVVADRSRMEMRKWPWNLVGRNDANSEQDSSLCLESLCAEPIGAQFITGKDEAYVLSDHCLRRLGIPPHLTRAYGTGEDVRNWTALPGEFILFPYDKKLAPLTEPLPTPLARHLKPFRETLENCVISGSIKKKDTHLKWFEFRRLARAKFNVTLNIVNPHIATHCHFLVCDHEIAFKEKALAIALRDEFKEQQIHLLAGWLNSSLLLERLKRECFNKGAGEDEHRDRFEFAGEKLRALSIPLWVNAALTGKPDALAERLTALSRACWESGRELPSLALRKLFEKSGEAYTAWNAALPGHVAPHAQLAAAFTTTAELQERFARAVSLREQLRAGMVARQEEMDWLVYAAYGLLPAEHPAAQVAAEPAPLDQAQRPFRLWESASGDFAQAVALIPADWPKPRRALWEARLAAIRDNEHVRRIEQPVYKRRWDEQWKVGNRWMSGPVAYAQEFVDAFRWWLAEKAEYLLEHKAAGGPVELGGWTPALWKDKRIEAAWPVVADAIHQVGQFKFDASENEAKKLIALDASYESFAKFLKDTVMDETVPAGIPPAVSWDDLAAKKKWTTAQLKKAQNVRGKLNVPRERFQITGGGEFVWVGEH